TLSFNACPLSINAPPGPSNIFLMYTVEIHSIARFDLHRFETEALFCCTYDCIFCDILIHFISNVPDMNCDIHMIYRLDPEGFDPSVLAYASDHPSVALPVCPSDLPEMPLVRHFSCTVLFLLKHSGIVFYFAIRIDW